MIGVPQYLLTLYIVEREDGEELLISPGYVTDALGHSPLAATERLQNLDVKGLMGYEPYEGATLIAEGCDAAADLYDTYQIPPRFCRGVLGVNDHEGKTMQLVGNVSPTVAEHLSATLFCGDGDRDGMHQTAGPESMSSPDNPVSWTHRRKPERSLVLVNKWY